MKKTIALVVCLSAMLCRAEFVGIDEDDFKSHYQRQKESMWCWASSAEMVLSYEGVKLPQETIVAKAKGMIVNQGGNPVEIINSVNGIFKNEDGDKVIVSGQYILGAPMPTVLYNQLKAKKPVILTYQASAYSGHAVVLTGIEATVTGGVLHITKIHIFDPFSYRQLPPTPIYSPAGYLLGYQPSPLEKDDSLITQELVITTWYGQVVLPGHGQITGMILVDGSKY